MSGRTDKMVAPALLAPGCDADSFPPPAMALREPNGLLAIGGDLSPERLLLAYRNGIFPWYSDEQPILWWSPQPRFVIYPERLKISRSLSKTLRKRRFRVTTNEAFEPVVAACAQPRLHQEGTWITEEMQTAYHKLHQLGHAMSIECWLEDTLAGGLYGVRMGRVFFGESMFTRRTDASKVALVFLSRMGFALIDCQLPNPHLSSLGAVPLERSEFMDLVARLCDKPLARQPESASDSRP